MRIINTRLVSKTKNKKSLLILPIRNNPTSNIIANVNLRRLVLLFFGHLSILQYLPKTMSIKMWTNFTAVDLYPPYTPSPPMRKYNKLTVAELTFLSVRFIL